ncbi:MAG: bile acid:sodium symporter family protein [Aeoliella sp.]
MLPFIQRHWFLSLLAAVLAIGLWQGPSLAGEVEQLPRGWLVAGVMFLTALPMAFRQLTSVVRSGKTVGLALLINMAVAPPVAWLLGRVVPDSLAIGLLIAASVPCTLASAAVWTRRGGGNDAIALAVTFVTNLSCFAVLPFWLWLFLRTHVERDPWELSMRLMLLVVAPVVFAQLLRLVPTIASASTKRKIHLSLAAQFGILAMVFMGAVSAGDALGKINSSAVGANDWMLMMGAVLALHLLLFALGWWASATIRADRPDQLAVAISGSQKTLMIGLDVAIGFGGLAVLPMVAYHVVQLVVDTLLVDRLRIKS